MLKRMKYMDIKEYENDLKETEYYIGTYLRVLRKKARKTLLQVSKEIGINRETLGSYERHARVPSTHILFRLAKYYGVTFEQLIGRDLDA